MRPAKLAIAVVIAALAIGCIGAIATLVAGLADRPATAVVAALVGVEVLAGVGLGATLPRRRSTPYW